MVLPNIELVVFDLDDTLFPEREFVKSGFHAVSDYLQKNGITSEALFPKLWETFCQGARSTIFNDVLLAVGIEPEERIISKLLEIYRYHKPSLCLFPDAEFILDHLHGRKKIGLLSDGYLETQKNKVAALNIERYFDIIMYTDSLGREFWKPHTCGYEKIMTESSVHGDMCLYIGDNPRKDFYGARQAGWKTVHVTRTDGIYSEQGNVPEEYMADVSVRDLYKLAEVIELY
jgi:putative hydrolase of the HAD superfamily